MRDRSLRILALCLCLLAAASACSHYRAATTLRSSNLRAYDGPARDKSEVGYLKCISLDLEIAAVDRKPIKVILAEAGFEGNYSYLELLPGPHSVRVVGTTFDTTQKRFHTNLTVDIASFTHVTTGESILEFGMEAGHVYLIDGRMEKLGKAEEEGKASHVFRIFVKDAQTGQIITEDRREIIK